MTDSASTMNPNKLVRGGTRVCHCSGGWSLTSDHRGLGLLLGQHVGFVVDKVELKQVFLHDLWFFPGNII
jgi:hypothetical protein